MNNVKYNNFVLKASKDYDMSIDKVQKIYNLSKDGVGLYD